jgi:hypothetical protein
MSGLAGVGVELLLFWDVPGRARAALVSALAGSLLLTHRRNNDSSKRRWTIAALAGGGLLALGSVRVWFSGTLILPRLVDEPGSWA